MATYLIGPALLSLSLVLRPVTDARPARAIQKTNHLFHLRRVRGRHLERTGRSTPPPLQWHDHKGLYLGIVVTDDEHEHAAGNAWNGDGVHGPDRSGACYGHSPYNYCIRDGYESGKVYKNGDAGDIADKERGPGNYSVAMVRDDAAKTTTYEALFAPIRLVLSSSRSDSSSVSCMRERRDADTPGQKGWSGWGPHMIVFGKTAPDAALVTLTGLEVISSFSEDFNGEDESTAS